MNSIPVLTREQLKIKPSDQSTLGFGQVFTDYMLQMDYTPEKGWQDLRVLPYGPITLDPANVSLHYGQLIFEGLKAYKNKNGNVSLFRPLDNLARMNRSGNRFCIPPFEPEKVLEGLMELIRIERDWIPDGEGTALYIRPFTIATENFLGVRPSSTYSFFTILSPVSNYYKEGVAPIRIYVEDNYVRAVRGGTGEAKCAGNYASSLISQKKAQDQGFAQVLWLDGIEQKYIEEIGTTNAFFVINDTVITPELNGSILPGITRDSTLKLLRHWGVKVEERKISIDEVAAAYKDGTLQEAFATGTAAVVSPIGELKYKDSTMTLKDRGADSIAMRVYENIIGIQRGELDDPFGWVLSID